MSRAFSFEEELSLLLVLSVTCAELVNPTSGVHQCVLACVEWMACRTDFHFDDRVFIPVLPSFVLFALSAAFAQEAPIRRQVFEDHGAVIIWMDSFFHGLKLSVGKNSSLFLQNQSKIFSANFDRKQHPNPTPLHQINNHCWITFNRPKPFPAVPCRRF